MVIKKPSTRYRSDNSVGRESVVTYNEGQTTSKNLAMIPSGSINIDTTEYLMEDSGRNTYNYRESNNRGP